MSAPQKRSLVLTMDAFGTLLRPRKPVVNQYREEAAKFGVTLFKHTEQDMENSFKTAFTQMKTAYPNHGGGGPNLPPNPLGFEIWWQKVIEKTLKPFTDKPLPKELALALVDRFSSSAGYSLHTDVLPFLEAISSRNPPPSWRYAPLTHISSSTSSPPASKKPATVLGILSNGDPRIPKILESFGIAHYFSFQTLSYHTGFCKPSRQIFRIARLEGLRIAEGNPDLITKHPATGREMQEVWQGYDFIHIGDNWAEDWLASRKLKDFQPVWINRLNQPLEVGSITKLKKVVSELYEQNPYMAEGMEAWGEHKLSKADFIRLQGHAGDRKCWPAVLEVANSTISDLSELFEIFPEVNSRVSDPTLEPSFLDSTKKDFTIFRGGKEAKEHMKKLEKDEKKVIRTEKKEKKKTTYLERQEKKKELREVNKLKHRLKQEGGPRIRKIAVRSEEERGPVIRFGRAAGAPEESDSDFGVRRYGGGMMGSSNDFQARESWRTDRPRSEGRAEESGKDMQREPSMFRRAVRYVTGGEY